MNQIIDTWFFTNSSVWIPVWYITTIWQKGHYMWDMCAKFCEGWHKDDRDITHFVLRSVVILRNSSDKYCDSSDINYRRIKQKIMINDQGLGTTVFKSLEIWYLNCFVYFWNLHPL